MGPGFRHPSVFSGSDGRVCGWIVGKPEVIGRALADHFSYADFTLLTRL